MPNLLTSALVFVTLATSVPISKPVAVADGPTGRPQASVGTIQAYKSNSLRTFTAAGQPLGRIDTSALPSLPAQIVGALPGGLIGVRSRAGEVVYLRGIDLEFALASSRPEICTPVTANNRSSGAVVPGIGAGGGSSQDCRPAR